MKKRILLLVLLGMSLGAFAQKKKGDIDYYTDSNVKTSRFSIDALLFPGYTDRRLINSEVPAGGGLDLVNENATGAFSLNYQLDFIYSVGSALDLSLGIGYMSADYSFDNALFYENRNDSIRVNGKAAVGLYTVPFKLNFNTAMSDAFELEVVPSVELAFVNTYTTTYTPVNGMAPFAVDYKARTNDINYLVGISLGGMFNLTENWGLIVRGNIKYMLNPLIEEDNYPREVLYAFGLSTGLRYRF
jgi:hypothetical protein